MPELIIFIISIAGVIKGADWLGEASINTAKKLGMPEVLIGATLVSVATTLPEILVSFFAGLSSESGIALGTVFGSPAANIGLIMGVLFFFGHAKPEKGYFSRTLNIFIFLLALILIIGIGGVITTFVGKVLMGLGIIYLIIEFFVSKTEESFADQVESRFNKIKGLLNHEDSLKNLVYFLLGALMMGVAARFLVDSASVLASDLKVPTIVLGATAVAFGTSIPEFATAITSIARGRLMLSVGNLVGASVIDLTIALGAGALVNPISVDQKALGIAIAALFVISTLNLSSILTRISAERIGFGLILVSIFFLLVFVSIEI
ncbi:MAG: hypothetical protein WD231_00690 [Candidatus Woykebacteria bacterium]